MINYKTTLKDKKKYLSQKIIFANLLCIKFACWLNLYILMCVCLCVSYLACVDEHEDLVQDGVYEQQGCSTFVCSLSSIFFWKTMEHTHTHTLDDKA